MYRPYERVHRFATSHRAGLPLSPYPLNLNEPETSNRLHARRETKHSGQATYRGGVITQANIALDTHNEGQGSTSTAGVLPCVPEPKLRQANRCRSTPSEAGKIPRSTRVAHQARPGLATPKSATLTVVCTAPCTVTSVYAPCFLVSVVLLGEKKKNALQCTPHGPGRLLRDIKSTHLHAVSHANLGREPRYLRHSSVSTLGHLAKKNEIRGGGDRPGLVLYSHVSQDQAVAPAARTFM